MPIPKATKAARVKYGQARMKAWQDFDDGMRKLEDARIEALHVAHDELYKVISAATDSEEGS